ncbi:MAG: hydrogenase maturation protease [Candidatus Hodarchaeota archaeon]
MNESKFLIVLGIGNSVRMDDGAGIRVVERLSNDNTLKKLKITFSFLNTGGLDILDEIDGYKRAIIVDAADMPNQLKPGEIIHLTDLTKLAVDGIAGVSSHGIGLLSVLKYAKTGGYQTPEFIEIYGIQVKETGYFSESLTSEVATGVNTLVERLKKYILVLFSDRK